MNAKEFVEAFYVEKQNFLKFYFSEDSESEVGKLIDSLGLNDIQFEKMKEVFDASLTDAFYTILLGLDGNASIGGIQEMYDLKDENGNQLSGEGEIESYAYQYFHEK